MDIALCLFLGGDAIEKTAHESSAVMKGLLRDKLGFKATYSD